MQVTLVLYIAALAITILSGVHICPDELAMSLQVAQCTCELCVIRAHILSVLQIKKQIMQTD